MADTVLLDFGMVLSGASTEILQERLKVLRMICRSLNSEWPDLQVRFGCNLELASQLEQGDVFLEKANQSLQSEENGTLQGITQFTTNAQGPIASLGNAASIGCHGQKASETNGKHHIFIRTFGHFDVFVDGEAILFNHSKAKELLALLVDRRGGFVGATEAISCLWEDEPANNTTLSPLPESSFALAGNAYKARNRVSDGNREWKTTDNRGKLRLRLLSISSACFRWYTPDS